MTGDPVNDFGGGVPGFLIEPVAFDYKRLSNAREIEVVVESGGDPDFTGFDSAMGQPERFAEMNLSAVFEEQADIFV